MSKKSEEEKCPECGGTGEVPLNFVWPGGDGDETKLCRECEGTGKKK